MTYRILRIRDVIQKTGLSRATTYRLMKEADFPPPIPLGAKSVGWIEAEVDEWIKSQMAKRQVTDASTASR